MNDIIIDILKQIAPYAISILSALTSLIITIIKTRQKVIQKKVDASLELSDYYISIDGKDFKLSDYDIKKRKS